jgi:orotidine-5'-phosphate decarboxylase
MSRDQLVRRFAVSAVESGLTGLVCSAREVGDIKLHDNTKGLLTLVPGTRSKGASSDDQKNITTPAQAIQAGADLLVIGRQVTAADSPEEAYEAVVEEIEGAL